MLLLLTPHDDGGGVTPAPAENDGYSLGFAVRKSGLRVGTNAGNMTLRVRIQLAVLHHFHDTKISRRPAYRIPGISAGIVGNAATGS